MYKTKSFCTQYTVAFVRQDVDSDVSHDEIYNSDQIRQNHHGLMIVE